MPSRMATPCGAPSDHPSALPLPPVCLVLLGVPKLTLSTPYSPAQRSTEHPLAPHTPVQYSYLFLDPHSFQSLMPPPSARALTHITSLNPARSREIPNQGSCAQF